MVIGNPISPIASVRGTWTGTLNDSVGGNILNATLVMDQPAEGTSVSGVLTLNDQAATHQEVYNVTGEFDGTHVRFSEPEGRAFWGTADSNGMRGQVGWCFECEAWAEFDVTLQADSSPANTEEPYSIRLADLQDGATVTPVIAANGFPVIDLQVETTGPIPLYSVLALEADDLWVSQAETDGADPSNTVLQWNAWHGNGNYTLIVQVLDYEAGGVLASKTVHVTVSGIPNGTLTVKERIIQVYQQQFGLNLTAPTIARYTKPSPYAVEESRWVSAAYMGNKLYEVNIFDNGFAGGQVYDLNSDTNGFCRPAGRYNMLVIFVDYGNTGLDPALGIPSIEEWRLKANRIWSDYSTSIGLSEPILQIDRMETAIVSAPPTPGQSLTVDQVQQLTGKNPSDFDLLVEIDLDANNSFAGQYGGLGISLNGGCLPGGAQRVNIAFSAIDQETLLNGAPGSVFGHELEHIMGWEHWWLNGLANNADQVDKGLFWMPTLLFGWTDTDGDGIIEILDTSTPYGLVP
jgi:hypothetical protein